MSRIKMRDNLYKKEWLELYDKLFPESHYNKTFSLLRKIIKKYNKDAKEVLELACGTGKYTKRFTEDFNVLGTDISKDALAVARKRARKANFKTIDMSKINENQKFDVVVCLYESFRYNKSYEQCLQTLKRAYKALRNNGIFMCDFGDYPSSKNVKIHNEVRLSNGKKIIKDETLYTRGNFDMRIDKVRIGSKVINLKRAPLLRISKDKMKNMLSNVGFKNIKTIKGFQPKAKRSYLFIGQKI